MRMTRRAVSILTGASLLGGAFFAANVSAQAPGPPDFFLIYGQVQVNGANISPEVQPVIAYVNGKVCGQGETLVATEGENVPESEIGKTVYRIDVRADGTRVDQTPGCGRSGDKVTLYFPSIQRFGAQEPTFKTGSERVDIALGGALQYRLVSPLVARDGSN